MVIDRLSDIELKELTEYRERVEIEKQRQLKDFLHKVELSDDEAKFISNLRFLILEKWKKNPIMEEYKDHLLLAPIKGFEKIDIE